MIPKKKGQWEMGCPLREYGPGLEEEAITSLLYLCTHFLPFSTRESVLETVKWYSQRVLNSRGGAKAESDESMSLMKWCEQGGEDEQSRRLALYTCGPQRS